jgi:hypothetical protein
MAVGAPCSPCAAPGRSRKRTYCVRAACITCAAVEYPAEASRRLGSRVDTDGAVTDGSPWRQPRSRTSSGGRRSQLAAVQRRPLSQACAESRLGVRRNAPGTRAQGIHSRLVDCRSVAGAAVACPVRRPGGCGPGPCGAIPRRLYPVHAPLAPCRYSLEQYVAGDRWAGNGHRLRRVREDGIRGAPGPDASHGLLCRQCTS